MSENQRGMQCELPSGSDYEMLGTEKCGNVRGEIAAELCHQGIGISFSTCCNNYHSGRWYKDARESEDNSTVIHANKNNKRWKLTILSENPTDVE